MNYKSVYFIGIGGISISGMAKYLHSKGVLVAGSDKIKTECTKNLEKIGIKVNYVQRKNNIKDFETIVYTDAISALDKELIWAKGLDKKIIKRAEFLNLISMDFKKTVAISGCHGKTTTTALTTVALGEFNPTAHIGGVVNGQNFIIGENNLFITEACEYKKNLLFLHPDVAVILNIGLDHLDCYKNLDDIIATFQKFANNVKEKGFVLVNGDDKNAKLIKHNNKYTFGLKQTNDFIAKNIKVLSNSLDFDFFAFGKKIKRIRLKVGLFHNVYNALASLSVAYMLKAKEYAKNIRSFNGVQRRNELVIEKNNIKVFHDYAHHPDEISKIIEEHKNFCNGKIVVAFEAHTYSRTRALENEFRNCFKEADRVFILPIYAAREKKINGVSGKRLAELCGAKFKKSYIDCLKEIKENVTSGDEVLILGAGNIFKLADLFKTLL